MKAPLPPDESKRLEVLRAYHILDTPPEQEFDDLTRLAAQICGTPISAVTLVDQDRQWFKSKVGLEASETPRDVAFCAHAILRHEPLVVPDATADRRFADNPSVTSDPHIRFYAGVPLETIEGQNIGTLCVIDTVPRDLEPSQLEALRILGGQVIALMERRRALTEVLESQSFLGSTLDALSSHIAVLDADGTILAVNRAWQEFAAQNQGTDDTTIIGTNYIGVCQNARGPWAEEAGEAAAGIRAVVAGTLPDFSLEYPCHTPSQQRWFNLTVTRFAEDEAVRVTVAHENITERKLAEIAVHQSEQEQTALASQLEVEKERLVAAQSVAKVGSWETDLSTMNVAWSAETYRIYNLSPAQFSPTYDTLQLMVHPADRDKIDQAFKQSVKASGSYVIEHRILLADGTIKFLEQNWQVIHDEQGNPVRIIGTTQDITERKEAEQQLHRQAHLLNVVGQAVIVTDKLGVINYWNDYAEQLYGWSAAEAVGRNVVDVTATDVTKNQAAEIMKCLVRGESWEGEFQARKRDGTEFPIHVTDTPVLDEAGNVESIIGISLDITERKRAEESVRASEASLAEAQARAHLGNWELDMETLVGRWSAENARLHYQDPSEEAPVFSEYLKLIHPEDVAHIIAMQERITTATAPLQHIHRTNPALGPVKYLQTTMDAIRDSEGRMVSIVGTSLDVTEQRQAEAERREIFERIADAFVALDTNWNYTFINERAGQILGRQPEDLIGKNIWEEYPDIVAQNDYTAIHKAMAEQQTVFTEDFYAPLGLWLETRIYPSPEGVTIYFHDISERKQAEEKLRQSEIQFRAVFDNALDAIVITDNEGRFLEVNEAACEIYGTERDQLLSMKLSDFIEADRNFPQMVQDFRTSHAEKGEFLIFLTDGTHKYVGFSSTADFLPDRHLTALRDVTERKATGEAIGRLAAIVQSSNDAIIGKTLDGLITSWNNGAQILYGYSAEEAIGRHASFLLAEDRPNEETQLLAGIARGESIANYETVRVRKDGSTIDVSLTFSPVTNEADEIIGASVIARDISERKQAEMALRASEQQFRAFMDNTPARVFIKDREGRYIYLNNAVEQFRKSPVSELQGKTVYHNFPISIAEPVHRNDLKVFTSGQPQQFEETIVSPDGELHYEIVSKFLLPDTDGHQLLAGIAVDVTDQRKAEQQRDRFFSMSLDMLCISGFDGYFQRVNPAFTLALGHTEKELLAISFVEFVHPDDVAATEEALQTLANGGVPVGFENRYRHKDGTWHWLEWKANAEGQEGLIYAAAHDITERKSAQADLLKMRDDLEVRVEERTRELVQINAKLTGEILDRKRAESVVRAQARQQEVVAELGQRALAGTEIEILFSGGIALISATLEADVCSIRELLPDEESLLIRAGVGLPADAVGHEKISALPDTIAGYALSSGKPVIVQNLREERRFTPAPSALAQGVNSSVNVLIPGADKPFGLICCGSTRGRVFNRDDVHFLQAVANVLSVAITRASVEQEIFQLNTQLQAGNEQLRVENIEHQTTMEVLRTTAESLKQATAEANAANLAKSEFLSRMSHELRTPLNAILGFGQILERKNLDELAQESLGYILKGGRHLLDLINEILDMARVESGHVDLSLEPIALDDIMPDACALVRPLAEERAIRLKENWAALAGTHVSADHQRLKQVLLNLLSNAIKYNREGGEVEVICQQNTEGRITIAVRDTGPGIAPQDLSKLFTPFERLNAAKSNVEGTGLGLALSERLVTAMNGTLGVESTLGQGTTFTIELPQATPPLETLNKSAHQITTVEPTQTSEQTYTLLCIEDNPSNLHLVESILHSRPEITLLTAIQGSVGIDLARQHEPDLILLDLNLPDIHGSEVLARLQKSAVTREIPVVVVSADATSRQIEKLMAAGAEAYLTKPLDVDQFLHTIDKFLGMETKTALSSDNALNEAKRLL